MIKYDQFATENADDGDLFAYSVTLSANYDKTKILIFYTDTRKRILHSRKYI